MDTTASAYNTTLESQPGVVENPHGGYHIHIQLNEHEPDTTRNRLLNPCPAMPPGTRVLVEMLVFEDCVLLNLPQAERNAPSPVVDLEYTHFYWRVGH